MDKNKQNSNSYLLLPQFNNPKIRKNNSFTIQTTKLYNRKKRVSQVVFSKNIPQKITDEIHTPNFSKNDGEYSDFQSFIISHYKKSFDKSCEESIKTPIIQITKSFTNNEKPRINKSANLGLHGLKNLYIGNIRKSSTPISEKKKPDKKIYINKIKPEQSKNTSLNWRFRMRKFHPLLVNSNEIINNKSKSKSPIFGNIKNTNPYSSKIHNYNVIIASKRNSHSPLQLRIHARLSNMNILLNKKQY